MTLSTQKVSLMMISPLAGRQVSATTGGGLLDMFTGGATQGAAGQTTGAAKKDDGSVGLFDGVLTKALMGGAAGVGIGFLPFIPGGPILGGIVGSVIGAGVGIFMNFRKIKTIQNENAAFIAAVGVQPQTQEEQQMLLSGNIQQLYTADPNQAAQQQTAAQDPTAAAQQQALAQQQAAQQQTAAQAQQNPATDLSMTQTQQTPVPTQGNEQQVATTTQQTPVPTQGNDPQVGTMQTPAETEAVPKKPTVLEFAGSAGGLDIGEFTVAPGGAKTAVPKEIADLENDMTEREKRVRERWINGTPEQRQAMLEHLKQQIARLQERLAVLQSGAGAGQAAEGVQTAAGGGAPTAAGGAALCATRCAA